MHAFTTGTTVQVFLFDGLVRVVASGQSDAGGSA